MTVSEPFLVFYNLDSFKKYWSVILQNILNWDLSGFFHDYTEVMGSGEKDNTFEVPFSSHSIKGTHYQHDLSLDQAFTIAHSLPSALS